jgi:hypothetical protein
MDVLSLCHCHRLDCLAATRNERAVTQIQRLKERVNETLSQYFARERIPEPPALYSWSQSNINDSGRTAYSNSRAPPVPTAVVHAPTRVRDVSPRALGQGFTTLLELRAANDHALPRHPVLCRHLERHSGRTSPIEVGVIARDS